MKRLIIFLFLSTALSWMTSAKQVEERNAGKVAGNFFASRIDRNQFKTLPSPVLVYTASQKQAEKSNALPAFYIFNFSTPPGFVIVAADDAISPILAYSRESSFNTIEIPSNLAWWLEGYEMQITEVAAKDLKPAPAIKAEWEDLLADAPSASLKSADADDFLVKLLWHQNMPYNDDCPVVNVYEDRAPTGCVATAMAMIMKYHNYPAKGTGSNSYKSQYDTLTADFGNTTYPWDKMPDSLVSSSTTAEIEAVALLMYHCGVSFNINYGEKATSGRAAANKNSPDDICAENALKKYFGYDPNLRSVDRSDSTYEAWIKLLKTEIDAKRPILYSGMKYEKISPTKIDTSGHSFICDGYNSSNFFHFNWGWGPDDDNGFYKIDTSLKFPEEMDAIIGIQKNPLGVDDKEVNGMLIVYPNPSSGIVYLSNRSDKELIADLTVRNMLGRTVYSQQAASLGTDPYSIDLSGLDPGIYIVTLRDSMNQQSNIKLSIAR